MRVRLHRKRPEPWNVRRQGLKRGWTVPLWAFEWFCEWIAFALSNWSFLEVLEYLSSFGVLIAVIFYFGESGDRLKQKHYQAWQVLNTAGISLVGVDVSGAFLQSIRLQRASLARSNFSAADLRDSDLIFADLSDADLRSTNLRHCILRSTNLERADMTEADLFGADLTAADLSGATLANSDLRNTNLANLKWSDTLNVKNANIFGAKNVPEGFVAYALKGGALQKELDNP